MLNGLTTLKTAIEFASDLIYGDWKEVKSVNEYAVYTITHMIECETATATILVCAITGNVEGFKFSAKGDA